MRLSPTVTVYSSSKSCGKKRRVESDGLSASVTPTAETVGFICATDHSSVRANPWAGADGSPARAEPGKDDGDSTADGLVWREVTLPAYEENRQLPLGLVMRDVRAVKIDVRFTIRRGNHRGVRLPCPDSNRISFGTAKRELRSSIAVIGEVAADFKS